MPILTKKLMMKDWQDLRSIYIHSITIQYNFHVYQMLPDFIKQVFSEC